MEKVNEWLIGQFSEIEKDIEKIEEKLKKMKQRAGTNIKPSVTRVMIDVESMKEDIKEAVEWIERISE